MATLLEFLRSLGPAGATGNASAAIEARREEDRLAQAVARRLAPSGDRPPLVA